MTKFLKLFSVFLALFSSAAFAKAEPSEAPWMTGPLIGAPGHSLKPCEWELQPYIFVTKNGGVYNSHWRRVNHPGVKVINPLLIYGIGLLNNLDFHATLPFEYRFNGGAKSFGLADLSFDLGYQIAKDQVGTWRPDIRLVLKETFPLGKYQRLNAAKNGTDAMGSGAYTTGFGVNLQKLFQTFNNQFMSTRLNLEYAVSSSVHVHGVSAYSSNADGKVLLGNAFTAVVSFEQTLSRHFALAMDIQFQHIARTRFSGTSAIPGSVESPAATQWSLAPAIEYNINANCGLIAGIWFTFAGKNSPAFTSYVLSFTYAR